MRKRIRKTTGVGIAWAVILVAAPASSAQVDYFLKIDGIHGEVTEARRAGSIQIDLLQWHCYRPAGGDTGPNPVVVGDLTFW